MGEGGWLATTLAYGQTSEKIGLSICKNVVFSLGDGRRMCFWKGTWCCEVAFSIAFPTVFNLAACKADVWDFSRVDRGWSPVF